MILDIERTGIRLSQKHLGRSSRLVADYEYTEDIQLKEGEKRRCKAHLKKPSKKGKNWQTIIHKSSRRHSVIDNFCPKVKLLSSWLLSHPLVHQAKQKI